MTDTSIALLPDRGIVEVEGNDAVDFLQSLLTNDVEQAGPDRAIFAGLLTPQGKIVLDFLVYNPSPNRFLLDCRHDSAAALARQLGLYRLRAKVAVADRSAEMAIGVASEHGHGGLPTPAFSIADPRHAQPAKATRVSALITPRASRFACRKEGSIIAMARCSRMRSATIC
jgi:folate-binding Fe-S cluster repair protein YgfZ